MKLERKKDGRKRRKEGAGKCVIQVMNECEISKNGGGKRRKNEKGNDRM